MLESYFLYPQKGVRELGTTPPRKPGAVPRLGGPFWHYKNCGFWSFFVSKNGPNYRVGGFSFCSIWQLLWVHLFFRLACDPLICKPVAFEILKCLKQHYKIGFLKGVFFSETQKQLLPHWKFAGHQSAFLLTISDFVSLKPRFFCRNLGFENARFCARFGVVTNWAHIDQIVVA